MTRTTRAAALGLALLAGQATAGDGPLGLVLEGSFGEGGFARQDYVPPINNPVFNETPFITTEARPFYAYHDIPDDFLTGGGNVNVVGLQLRLALTERLGFIATTDGYSFLDFNSVLPDEDGFNDIAAGFKYALVNDPANGLIVTPGLRYTIPVGNISTGGLDLNGHAGGYFNPFVTASQIIGNAQIQGMVGAQISPTDDGTSTFLASLTANYEVAPDLFPMVELNLLAPFDGGDQIPASAAPLDNLTGADIFDLGSANPETILNVGGGVRYRLTDNLIFGVGADVNTLQDRNHVYGWRVTTDLVIHF